MATLRTYYLFARLVLAVPLALYVVSAVAVSVVHRRREARWLDQ